MSYDDLESVLAIEEVVQPFPWTRTIFQDCLHVGYCCWVMERNATIIAYGVMSVAAGESHILNLCVRPEWQGLGLGTTVLNYLLDIARKHRADTVSLEVRSSNQAAKRMYQAIGFDDVGMRRDYYPTKRGREDAVIMSRRLHPNE